MTEALRIRAIETIPIRAPLAREFRGSHYRMTHRATIITRVVTESGVVGEAYVGDEDATMVEIDRVIRDEVAPMVVGLDAFAVERCWQAAYPVTYDILRDRRIGLVALAGVDLAIWDAVGKALGQPLWRLWGGYTNRVPLIAIGGYYGSPQTISEEMAALRDLGVAGCKFKVGGLTPRQDADRVAEARDAAGDEFVLMIDANQAYTPAEAVELCQRIDGLGVRWFEEPCRWHNDHRNLRDVRARTHIAICAGQSELSVSGCRDLMQAGAVDVCNFDSSWSGGPTAWRRAAAVAHSYDVEMGHHEEPHVAAHLIASQPHGTYAECFHPDRDPFWWNLIANRPQLANGMITLTETPGLGWQLDAAYVKTYRLDH
jgi:D-galactarolactone cycloisomerase